LQINGDDLLFQTRPIGRLVWSVVGREVCGLIESVGKTYYSDEFVEINSRLFHYLAQDDPLQVFVVKHPDGSLGSRPLRFQNTPLINMGLVRGVKRSTGVVGIVDVIRSDREMDLGTRMRVLDGECQSGGGFGYGIARACRRAFLAQHLEVLKQTRVPWYVPQRYGGLGLVGLPSEKDVRLMRAAALRGLHFCERASGDWKCWQIADRRLRKYSSLRRTLPSDRLEESNHMLSLSVVDCLFNSRYKITDLLCTEARAAALALRHNERLWQKLSRGTYGFPTLEWKIRDVEVFSSEMLSIVVSQEVAGSQVVHSRTLARLGAEGVLSSERCPIFVTLTDIGEIMAMLAHRWKSAVPVARDLYY